MGLQFYSKLLEKNCSDSFLGNYLLGLLSSHLKQGALMNIPTASNEMKEEILRQTVGIARGLIRQFLARFEKLQSLTLGELRKFIKKALEMKTNLKKYQSIG